MAKGFGILRVKSAVKSRSKMSLDRSHLTTMEFGQIVPLFSEELIPGDKFDINANYFSRMAPLVKPTYGKFSFRTMAGFVPYHQIAHDSDAWLAGKTTWEGKTPHHRYFTASELVNLFRTSVDSPITERSSSDAYYDFLVFNGSSANYNKLTPLGRFYYKILTSLGYTHPQNANVSASSAWMENEGPKHLSAYPLLAFAKLYNDYMSQSQRYNSSPLSAFLHDVKHGISTTGFDATTGALSYQGLRLILDGIRLCYENGYFTSAWMNPNTPLNSLESIGNLPVEAAKADVDRLYTGQSQTGIVTHMTTGAVITQRALDFLKSFDDWVRRNNYSGSRAVQQIYSRFGIKTDDYRSNYAHILGTDVFPISVGDVTSTAETEKTSLGDYAGKGIVSASKGLSYSSSDYGMLFILGYFTVTPFNAYGFNKTVLRSDPLDYYNPEFDGIGGEPISQGEVFVNPSVSSTQDSTDDSNIFGFTERYNAYRFGRDLITGDFRKMNNDAPDNTWHSGRLLTDVRNSGEMVAQSSSMNQLSPINSEYNRFFSVTDSSVDHFYLTCDFKVNAIRPMMSLNQVPRLGEGDTVVPRNGNEVN